MSACGWAVSYFLCLSSNWSTYSHHHHLLFVSQPRASRWPVRARYCPSTITSVCGSQGSSNVQRVLQCSLWVSCREWMASTLFSRHPSCPATHPTQYPLGFRLDETLPLPWHIMDKQPAAFFPCALCNSKKRLALITKGDIKHSSIM